MDVIDYLASSNYIIVNRSLMAEIGVNEALVLGELASECKYWREVGKLREGEWFFSTDDNIAERVPFSKPTIRRAIDKLKELGIIDTKLMGMPAKRFIRLIIPSNHGYKNLTNHDYKNLTNHKNTKEEYKSEEDNPEEKAAQPVENEKQVRMKPTALRQQLSLIFKAKDVTKSRSLNAIRKLQEQFDDDSVILEAARKMKDRGEIKFKDGTTWKADYFWFVNPDRTDAVVRGILKMVSSTLSEEELSPWDQKRYDLAIKLGAAKDYEDCRDNWGMILPKIISTPEYRELENDR